MAWIRPPSAFLTALEHDEVAVRTALQRVRRDLPAYDDVPDARITLSLHRNLHRAVSTLTEGVVPRQSAIWEAGRTTTERLDSGVAIEDIMSGFRVSISSIQDRMIQLASQYGVDDGQIARLTQVLWKLSDAFSAQAAATYREHGLALEVARRRLHDDGVVSLLKGTATPDRAARFRSALGLNATASVLAICTREAEPAALAAVQRALEAHSGTGLCLTAATEGRLVGIVSREPEPVPGVLLAVSAPTALDGLADGFQRARRLLDAAPDTQTGVVTAASLGWRALAPLDPHLVQLLDERYLAPLRARGSSAHLLATVRAYLDGDRQITTAAATLGVHTNTVRYRLARFEELCGASLAGTDTVVELSLLLQTLRAGDL